MTLRGARALLVLGSARGMSESCGYRTLGAGLLLLQPQLKVGSPFLELPVTVLLPSQTIA
jgi:hypothetical protein